jgi:hypothetical protein
MSTDGNVYRCLVRFLKLLALLPCLLSCKGASTGRESSGRLPSFIGRAALGLPPPCAVRLANVDFEACNLDPGPNPLCFHFAVRVAPDDKRRGCVPGYARFVILGSRINQTDELAVTTRLVSRDAASVVVELRLQSVVAGSQGFFTGTVGSIVGTMSTTSQGAGRFDLGSALLPSAIDVRTAERTDVIY